MSADVVSVLAWLSPAARMVVVSDAVNSRKPSPEVMLCEDTAPASSQPSQPAVLRSELPSAVTLTSCVQRTASAPPGGGGGGGEAALRKITALPMVALGLKRLVSTSSGYAGATVLV